ncbi:MAG: hypothetical protein UH239_07690 [Acutalibacteraceae bacterium]|nr:hypothetical protein [Acutalibacteraceae bacterium]
MDDMLSKIVNMDEKVRMENKQAEQTKADSFKVIAKKKDAIYNDYISRARERIKKNEIAEREAAEKKWQELEAKQKVFLDGLDELYVDNGEKWVETIVQNVINS